ncbi:MAG: NAD(P)-dependent oxidoreductase [Spirochaetales bacterium]|nr:NAD(P)-dependent oxidoreductase [Spirochaetales bacterium]
MKVLVTGVYGLLGSTIKLEAPSNFEIFGYDIDTLDITDSAAVAKVVEEISPDLVIHCAALTNVDYCEEHPDQAFRINVTGTINLLKACMGRNIKFVYISSTGIYGDYFEKEYSELDNPEPLSIHHKTKFLAERAVHSHVNNFLIVRIGWLFGGNEQIKKNFIKARIDEAKKNPLLYSDPGQKGNPTYVCDLVKQLFVLLENNCIGVYNVVGEGTATRYEYVKEIIRLSGVNSRVEAGTPEMFVRKAPVSWNESAKNFRLELENLSVMRSWKLALAEFIEKSRGVD